MPDAKSRRPTRNVRVGKRGKNAVQQSGLSRDGARLPGLRDSGNQPHQDHGGRLPDPAAQPFICGGCGQPIDKSDVSVGHAENCPFWGSTRFARVNRNSLHELFRYHTPSGDQAEKYIQLRKAAYDFANVILTLTPVCEDQQVALRRVREAMMTANAAIATRGIC